MIELKEISYNKKKSLSMEMSSDEFEKIIHLFEHIDVNNRTKITAYRPKSKLLNFTYDSSVWSGMKWTLYAMGTTDSKNRKVYTIFGRCGDYGFGKMGWWDCKHPGNIRAARSVYKQFQEMLSTKVGSITGELYGI
jgi:hypothetical protein